LNIKNVIKELFLLSILARGKNVPLVLGLTQYPNQWVVGRTFPHG